MLFSLKTVWLCNVQNRGICQATIFSTRLTVEDCCLFVGRENAPDLRLCWPVAEMSASREDARLTPLQQHSPRTLYASHFHTWPKLPSPSIEHTRTWCLGISHGSTSLTADSLPAYEGPRTDGSEPQLSYLGKARGPLQFCMTIGSSDRELFNLPWVSNDYSFFCFVFVRYARVSRHP